MTERSHIFKSENYLRKTSVSDGESAIRGTDGQRSVLVKESTLNEEQLSDIHLTDVA